MPGPPAPASRALGSAVPLPAAASAPAASRAAISLVQAGGAGTFAGSGLTAPARAAHRSESEASRQLAFSQDLAREKKEISWCHDTQRGGAGEAGSELTRGSSEGWRAPERASRVAHLARVAATWRVRDPSAVRNEGKQTLPPPSTPNHPRRRKKDFQTWLLRRRCIWSAKQTRDLDGLASGAGFISSPKCLRK